MLATRKPILVGGNVFIIDICIFCIYIYVTYFTLINKYIIHCEKDIESLKSRIQELFLYNQPLSRDYIQTCLEITQI